MEAEFNPSSRPNGEPTSGGQQMPPPDGNAPYPYPYPYPSPSSYPPAYPYGAPPGPQQQQAGGPVAPAPYYPYGAPAPPPPPPPPNRSSGARCCTRCLSCILTFILFFLILSILLRLLINPYLPEVEVSSVDISGFVFSAAGHLFSAKFDVILAVSNPSSDASIHYDDLAIAVLYEEQVLAFALLPPFRQDQENTTNVESLNMVAENRHMHEDKAEDMESERSDNGGHGDLTFQVRMFAYVRFSSLEDDWRSSKYEMRTYCDEVIVGFSGGENETGTLANGRPASCRVAI